MRVSPGRLRGTAAELQRWLQPGDLVEAEIERIGVLRSHVEQVPARISE